MYLELIQQRWCAGLGRGGGGAGGGLQRDSDGEGRGGVAFGCWSLPSASFLPRPRHALAGTRSQRAGVQPEHEGCERGERCGSVHGAVGQITGGEVRPGGDGSDGTAAANLPPHHGGHRRA